MSLVRKNMNVNKNIKRKKNMNANVITPAFLRESADKLEALAKQLEAEQNTVLAALAGKGIAPKVTTGPNVIQTKRGPRIFTPASRRKIAEGQKRRWAAKHAADAAAAAATNGGQPATPAAPAPVTPAPAAPVPAQAPVAVAA